MIKTVFVIIAAALIIVLFSYAAVARLRTFEIFIEQIENQPLPNSWTPFLTHAIPAWEMISVLFLLLPRTRKIGFILSAIFFLTFLIYTILILAGSFEYIPCTCAGVIDLQNWWPHFWLTSGFLALSVTGALMLRHKIQ